MILKWGEDLLGFKLLLSGVTDGTYFIPLMSAFLFSKDVCHELNSSKDSLVRHMILRAIKLFGDRITRAADGAFATKSLFAWCIDNVVRAELQMHSNRKVLYKGRTLAIRSIKELQPKGRHMSRTIQVIWHDMLIYITAQRRINQHGEETIVYQAATYKAKPSAHGKNYKNRWPIEKFFRTAKQHLGLRDCFSRKMTIQLNHIAAVCLGYAFLQLACKSSRLKTPEESMRYLKHKKVSLVEQLINRMVQIFECDYA